MDRPPINLCLPLIKYSYAENDTARDIVHWSHYTAVGLCLLLRGDHDAQGRLQMDIIEKMTTKETVDLAHHIDVANAARQSAQQTGVSLNIEQLPIFGITKDASLALRYRTSAGRARRIQLRLQEATQCDEVVGVLKHRGLTFHDQRPTTGQPSTATTGLEVSMSRTRPHTSQNSSTHTVCTQSMQSPFHPPSMAPGSLGQNAQQARHPVNLDSNARHSRADDMFPDPPLASLTHDRLAALENASRPPQSRLSNSSVIPQTTPGPITRQPGSSHEDGRSRVGFPWTVPENTCDPQPSSSDAVGPPPWTASSSNSLSSATHESMAHAPDINRQMASTDPIVAAKVRSRPSSALDLPPLQKPRIAKAQSASASEVPLFSVPKLQVSQHHDARADQGVEARQGSVNAISVAVPSTNQQPLSVTGCPNEQAMRNKQMVPGHLTGQNRPRLNSLMDAPHELESDYESGETASFAQQHKRGLTRAQDDQPILRHDFLRGATANLIEDGHLERYAAQRPQDREAALNKFMMDRLADPAFALLCADVENCWRRIALGL